MALMEVLFFHDRSPGRYGDGQRNQDCAKVEVVHGIAQNIMHRPERGRLIAKSKLKERVARLGGGDWLAILNQSVSTAERHHVQVAGGDEHVWTLWRRGQRGLPIWCRWSGISSVETRRPLRSSSTSPRAREDLSPMNEVRALQLRAPFNWNLDTFKQRVRTAKRGDAGGLSGGHIRSLLENPHDSSMLFRAAEELSKTNTPDEIIRLLRIRRMTALQEPRGGKRHRYRRHRQESKGHTVGGGIRTGQCPLPRRTIHVQGANACLHVLRGLTDLREHAAIMFIDGIGTYPSISRRAMLEGLKGVPSGKAVPFVRQFYGVPSYKHLGCS